MEFACFSKKFKGLIARLGSSIGKFHKFWKAIFNIWEVWDQNRRNSNLREQFGHFGNLKDEIENAKSLKTEVEAFEILGEQFWLVEKLKDQIVKFWI